MFQCLKHGWTSAQEPCIACHPRPPIPRYQQIKIVEAPGDRCGNTKTLPDGQPCPGCRACA